MSQRKKNSNCKNINSVNPLYLGITHANGYIEEKDTNKYLVFNSTDEYNDDVKSIMMFLMALEIKSNK